MKRATITLELPDGMRIKFGVDQIEITRTHSPLEPQNDSLHVSAVVNEFDWREAKQKLFSNRAPFRP